MHVAALKQATAFLKSWLNYRFQQTNIPGLSVAIAYKGDIVFSQTYGFADVEHRTPLHANHLFGVASQTKMFVATAIMQLVQNNKIALDETAHHYLPWLANHSSRHMREITIRQLLSHSAGLARDLPEADFWYLTTAFPTTAALRQEILSTPVVTEPNTQLKYSNAGYALLGQVIATASDQPCTTYITKHIIHKLGLRRTVADYTPALADQVVTGYGVPYGKRRPVLHDRRPTNAVASAAGIHATTEDMCRFTSALCMDDDRVLSDRSKKEIQRSQWVQSDGYDAGLELGLGFEILSVNGRRRIVGHSGHIAGHLSATYFDPYDQLAVSVAANSKDAPSPKITMGIFEILDYFAAHGQQPVPAHLKRFNARLYSPIATVEMVATADKIIAINPDDWQPFAYYEELEQTDKRTLRITTDGSIFNYGELVRYIFTPQETVASATYAGCTLLPEAAYRRTFLPGQSAI